jgi:lipopolysaccharide cholinephosphotransferase
MALLEMYKDVASVLDANNIRFYLIYGSAIGAVRHKGFVPWDDDIDIAVMECDIEKMERALENNLDPEKYYFHKSRADYHPHVIRKSPDMESDLRQKKSIFMDIFIISGYPKSPVREQLHKIALLGELGTAHVVNLMNTMPTHRMFSWSVRMFAKLRRFLVGNNTAHTTIVGFFFKKCIFDESVYGEPVMFPFEDTYAPLPQGYDEMLRSIYGDYMTPPPENERKGASGFPSSVLQDYILDKKEGKTR